MIFLLLLTRHALIWGDLNARNVLVPVATYSGHQGASYYVKACLSPDGRYLLSGSSDLKAYLWDVASRQRRQRRSPYLALNGHGGEVTAVAWCPVGDIRVRGGNALYITKVALPTFLRATLIGQARRSEAERGGATRSDDLKRQGFHFVSYDALFPVDDLLRRWLAPPVECQRRTLFRGGRETVRRGRQRCGHRGPGYGRRADAEGPVDPRDAGDPCPSHPGHAHWRPAADPPFRGRRLEARRREDPRLGARDGARLPHLSRRPQHPLHAVQARLPFGDLQEAPWDALRGQGGAVEPVQRVSNGVDEPGGGGPGGGGPGGRGPGGQRLVAVPLPQRESDQEYLQSHQSEPEQRSAGHKSHRRRGDGSPAGRRVPPPPDVRLELPDDESAQLCPRRNFPAPHVQ